MVEIRTLQKDLLEGLVNLGFLSCYENGLSYSHISNRNLLNPKIVLAAICAGLYPQIGKIVRPAQKYTETQGGKVEKIALAEELEFYILENVGREKEVEGSGMSLSSSSTNLSTYNNGSNNGSNSNINNNNNKSNNDKNSNNKISTNGNNVIDDSRAGLIKVLIHNSSVNFTNVTYKSSNYILYSEKKLNAASGVGKEPNTFTPYLHDITEISPFPLLFFGGEIEAQYAEGTVTVDKWIKFSAPGKLVVLILSLRKSFDELLTEKILDPEFEISDSKVLQAVCLLFSTDGLDSGKK
jgi:Oligonucleotide/oligosaccharide-binding (OB)-fold